MSKKEFLSSLAKILDNEIGKPRQKIGKKANKARQLLGHKERVTPTGIRKKPIELGYKEKYPEPLFTFNSNFPKSKIMRWTPETRLSRCGRMKPITEAVEKKYNIPNNLLLAMMAEEGVGDPIMPNIKAYNKNGEITKSDGGLGAIHIQGANAVNFGLKTLPLTKGKERQMKDMQHGQRIIDTLKKTTDLKKLIKYDDRFHPIIGIDASARFLTNKTKGKTTTDRINALYKYSGRGDVDYVSKVMRFRFATNIAHGETMPADFPRDKKITYNDFNRNSLGNFYTSKTKKTSTLKEYYEKIKTIEAPYIKKMMSNNIGRVNQKPMKMKDYWKAFEQQRENYGLTEYKKHQEQ